MRYLKLIVFILTSILIINTGYAIKMSPADAEYDYEPGATKTIPVYITAGSNWDMINQTIYLGSDMDMVWLNPDTYEEDVEKWYPTFHLSDSYIYMKGGDKQPFDITFTMPKNIITPGQHRAAVIINEAPPKSRNQFSAKAALAFIIKMNVPYPGKYLELEFKPEPTPLGEVVFLTIKGTNRGKENISSAKAKITIYDYEGNIVDTLESQSKSIAVGATEELWIDWNPSTDLKPGVYPAKVEVDYDDKKANTNADILLGGKNVLLINYTKDLYDGQINSFEASLQSLWNNKIPVYVQLTITKDGQSIAEGASSPVTLQPWQKQGVTVYVSTPRNLRGAFNGTLTIFYDNLPHEYPIKVNIGEKKAPKEEMPTPMKDKTGISWTPIIIGVLVFLLVLGQVIFFFFIRRSDDDDDEYDDF